MSKKQLFVASEVQVELMNSLVLPEIRSGFWKDHRPAGHALHWDDVEILVTTNNHVGPVNFTPPRAYSLVGPEFLAEFDAELIRIVHQFQPGIKRKYVRKIVKELSAIINGHQTDLSEVPVKVFRGNNLPDTRENKDVLSSGKGLGSEEWLPVIQSIIDSQEQYGVVVKSNHDSVTFERAARAIRLFLTGAGTLAAELANGTPIASIPLGSNVADLINVITFTLTTVNGGNSKVTADCDIITITSNGAKVVQRRSTRAIKVPQNALRWSNPFGI